MKIRIDNKICDFYKIMAANLQPGHITYSINARKKDVIALFEVVHVYHTEIGASEVFRLLNDTGFIAQDGCMTIINQDDEPVFVNPLHEFYVLKGYGQKIEEPE